MTRWLMACRSPRASIPGAELRWMTPDRRRFAATLTDLGPVLCLWADRPGGAPDAAPDLPTLARPSWLCHACAVTRDGPRESLTVCDEAGIARVRLHLLPDTDYLAWDALVAAARGEPAASGVPSGRVDRARRLRFVTQRLGPCELLCVRTPGTAGALSWRTAQQLAQAEGVRLGG